MSRPAGWAARSGAASTTIPATCRGRRGKRPAPPARLSEGPEEGQVGGREAARAEVAAQQFHHPALAEVDVVDAVGVGLVPGVVPLELAVHPDQPLGHHGLERDMSRCGL